MEIKAIDGTVVDVQPRKVFRVADALLRVKRVKIMDMVAARGGGQTPTVLCTFEGGVPPPFMAELKLGAEVPFPGDVVASLLKEQG